MKRFICPICSWEFYKGKDGIICCICSDKIKANLILEHMQFLKSIINRYIHQILNALKGFNINIYLEELYMDCRNYYQYRISFKI